MQNRETLVRLLTAALLIDMLVGFTVARGRVAAAREEAESLDRACAALREENEALRREIDAASDPQALEEAARERLGLVMPGEKIFYFD